MAPDPKRVSPVWVALPVLALCLGGVVWVLAALPGPSAPSEPVLTPASERLEERPAPMAGPERRLPPREVRLSSPAAPPPPLAAPAPATGREEEEASLAAQAEVAEQVQERLRELHEQVVDRCWPDDAAPGQRGRLTLRLVVDAEGRELARAFSEHRDASVPKFGECVTGVIDGLEVRPPGRPVTVDVVLDFP
jgi:hypothetical protein